MSWIHAPNVNGIRLRVPWEGVSERGEKVSPRHLVLTDKEVGRCRGSQLPRAHVLSKGVTVSPIRLAGWDLVLQCHHDDFGTVGARCGERLRNEYGEPSSRLSRAYGKSRRENHPIFISSQIAFLRYLCCHTNLPVFNPRPEQSTSPGKR